MSIVAGPFPYENITRRTTDEERAQIERIDLNDGDIERLVDLFRDGLRETAQFHSAAVQNNFQIRAEVSVRLSRPIQSEDGARVEEIVSRSTIDETIESKKVFKN
ncbi:MULTISPECIES: hypothetical protein [Burkholderia]|uniref:Uncharacterized protein n=1 Tax=Burkholderia savannae TaxID=1637837 RepID=A0ABR5THW0_9BURK|nr:MULTISPECIES: hypothetical protein [Burkholderia]AOJ70005.1 hypothetical protein WS78_15425 [Burkholderia savannae]AOJ81979.1 hypothetical protein WS86_16070 [Burkholderia savannae]AOK48126.1 hypothetical protein WT60_15630 [Burkholderia sp. MSMB617WGS]KGS07650.1 hypothetical protein X946_2103 [Burkholderia sp. ABCPW 111]KVG44003.1 hypothetical protein WS77_10665 [Burkholderia sp. MSMB0265]